MEENFPHFWLTNDMLKYANDMLTSIFVFTYYLHIYYFTYYLLTGNLSTIVKIFLLPHIYEHIIGLHLIKGFQNIKMRKREILNYWYWPHFAVKPKKIRKNRRAVWNRKWSWPLTHVLKRKFSYLSSLAKWLSIRLQTKGLEVLVIFQFFHILQFFQIFQFF